MKAKRILALLLCAVLLVAGSVLGTIAYMTAEDEAVNTFTVGNVNIELTEPSWTSSGVQDAPEVYAGEALKKDPTVTNTGANPCFVRVKVEGLNCLGNAGMITYETGYVSGALGADWVLHTDGYFYYTKVLEVGAKTSALFDQIRIPTGVTNGDGKTTYDITVTAYAVQAQGAQPSWTAVQGMTVEQIAAWFATCGM